MTTPKHIVNIEEYLYGVKKKNPDAEYSYGIRMNNVLAIYKTVDKVTKEVFVGPMTVLNPKLNDDMFYVDFVKSDVRVLIHFFI